MNLLYILSNLTYFIFEIVNVSNTYHVLNFRLPLVHCWYIGKILIYCTTREVLLDAVINGILFTFGVFAANV